jgi:hypothetical protein
MINTELAAVNGMSTGLFPATPGFDGFGRAVVGDVTAPDVGRVRGASIVSRLAFDGRTGVLIRAGVVVEADTAVVVMRARAAPANHCHDGSWEDEEDEAGGGCD